MENFKLVKFPFRDMVNLYVFGLSKKFNLNSAVSSETIFGERKTVPFAASLMLLLHSQLDNPLESSSINRFNQNQMAEKIKYHYDHFDDSEPERVTFYEILATGNDTADDKILFKNQDIIQEVVLFSHFVKVLKESKRPASQDFNLRLHRFLASVRGQDCVNLSLSKQSLRPESKEAVTKNSNLVSLTQLPTGFLQVVFLLNADYKGCGFTLIDIDKRISNYCKKSKMTRAERGRMIKEFQENFEKRIIIKIHKGYESGPLFVPVTENLATGEKRYVLNPVLYFDGLHFLTTTTEIQLAKFREAFQGRSLKLTSNFFSLYFWIVSTIHSNGGENIALKTSTLSKLIIYLPLTGKNGAQNLKTLNEHLDIIKSCCPEIGISFTAANNKLIRIDLSENKRNISRSVKS